MGGFDAVAFVRSLVDEHLAALAAPPPGVSARALVPHASGEIFGAARTLTTAGLASHEDLQAELGRFTDALVAGGFAERFTASMSSVASAVAGDTATPRPAEPREPAGPPALLAVVALTRPAFKVDGLSVVLLSAEIWSDRLVIRWAIASTPEPPNESLVAALLSAESWHVGDDRGRDYRSKQAGGVGGPDRIEGWIAVRAAFLRDGRVVRFALVRGDAEAGSFEITT